LFLVFFLTATPFCHCAPTKSKPFVPLSHFTLLHAYLLPTPALTFTCFLCISLSKRFSVFCSFVLSNSCSTGISASVSLFVDNSKCPSLDCVWLFYIHHFSISKPFDKALISAPQPRHFPFSRRFSKQHLSLLGVATSVPGSTTASILNLIPTLSYSTDHCVIICTKFFTQSSPAHSMPCAPRLYFSFIFTVQKINPVTLSPLPPHVFVGFWRF